MLSICDGHYIIVDMKNEATTVSSCLQQLRTLHAVSEADFVIVQTSADDRSADGCLTILVGNHRPPDLPVEIKDGRVTLAAAHRIVATRGSAAPDGLVLFADYVPPASGEALAEGNVNFVDAVGNINIHLDDGVHIWVQGKKPNPIRPGQRGLGSAAYQVLFGFLAKPQLLDESVRKIGDATGASKGTAANMIQWLEEHQYLVQFGRGRRLTRPDTLLEFWLAGYRATLRPHWLIGRYRTAATAPDELERVIEHELSDFGDTPWAWGGSAAASRLGGSYRGKDTILHIRNPPADLAPRIGASPAKEGNLQVLHAPAPLFLQGVVPRTAHPLLIYAELATTPDPRAIEAALHVRQTQLAEGHLG